MIESFWLPKSIGSSMPSMNEHFHGRTLHIESPRKFCDVLTMSMICINQLVNIIYPSSITRTQQEVLRQ